MKLSFLLSIPLFFCLALPMLNVGYAEPERKDLVTISIIIDNSGYFDELASHLNTLNFHNITFVILYNSAWNYTLHNATRVDLLKSYGTLIPRIDYIQKYDIASRKAWVDSICNDFLTYVGYYPKGIFDYVPDTWTAEYIKKTYNMTYYAGYCFDQYLIDYMTMRGGMQLPYYASPNHILQPSNAKGIVVFPHVTWDWIDSFTTDFAYNTHLLSLMTIFKGNETQAKNHWLKLIDASLMATSPFGYVTFQTEWVWMHTYGYQDLLFEWLDTLLKNKVYTFWLYQDIAEWFNANYKTNPNYYVNFKSPHSNERVEWYYSNEKRIARYKGKIVSFIDYRIQSTDKYRTETQTINWGEGWFKNPDNCIDITLYDNIKIDALGGGYLRFNSAEEGFTYVGEIADYEYGYIKPTVWYQDPITFGIITLGLALGVFILWKWK